VGDITLHGFCRKINPLSIGAKTVEDRMIFWWS